MKSPINKVDEEQNIKKRYRYDAFGVIIEESGSLENRITYTGQMYDGVTGQYYLRARFYNPKIGRFLQGDVYRGDGLNLYAYCQNNPVMYYDPSGYMRICPDAKFAPAAKETDDFVEVTLQHKEGMPINEFKRKAKALQALGEEGKLYKAENPVARDPNVTKEYRQDMINRIYAKYNDVNPEFSNKLINRVTKQMQPDHVWELQLGGPGVQSNIKFLDSYTNWNIGTQQIRPQIRNLETGNK